MQTARKRTKAATNSNKKLRKSKELDGNGRGDRDEASKPPKKKAVNANKKPKKRKEPDGDGRAGMKLRREQLAKSIK